jgi:hypothetical protein
MHFCCIRFEDGFYQFCCVHGHEAGSLNISLKRIEKKLNLQDIGREAPSVLWKITT